MEFETVTAKPVPMLMVTRATPANPTSIGAAMQAAFQLLGQFIGRNKVQVIGAPIAIYRDHSGNSMTMDVGMPVAAAELMKATGDIKAGAAPGGRALKSLHVGPYDRLRDTYALIDAELKRRGSSMPPISWEVYVDDPMTTAPANLRTEIYVPLAS